MKEQKEIEKMNQTQQTPWLVNNILFCYEGEIHTGNDREKKHHFLQHKGNHRKPTLTNQIAQVGK